MKSITLVGLFCVIIALKYVDGAPPRHDLKDFRRSFVEFLHQDKELSALLDGKAISALSGGPSLSRPVRQVEDLDNNPDFGEDGGPNKEGEKPGFFDRAARFVMEVLQRFLKWVNSDN